MTLRQRQEYSAFLAEEQAKQEAAEAAKRLAAFEQERTTIFTAPSARLAEICQPASKHRLSEEMLATAIEFAFQSFRRSLAASGVKIEDQAIPRFVAVAGVNPTLNYTKEATWKSVYDHLESLGVWTDADRTITQQPQPVPPVQKKPSIDDISLNTREGERLGKEIAFEDMTDEWGVVFRQFTDEIFRSTGHVFTDSERRSLYNLMLRRGLDFRNMKHLHQAKCALIRAGELDPKLYTKRESLDAFIEKSDINDPEVRQEIARRNRVIVQEEAGRIGINRI
jgi:hypothetical protein